MENGVIVSGRWKIPILYEDNHLLAVVKPVNLPSQADSSGDMDMLTLLKAYIGEKYHKPGAVYLGLVHRLDRPVGGVMVFARTSKAASRLGETFRTHAQNRRYLLVCEDRISEETELNDFLWKDPKTGNVRAVSPDTPEAKAARLITRPIAYKNGLTLAEARLFTGRSHQIRVQHAQFGHPLWGDLRYGHGKVGQQIALWAWKLDVEHPTRHELLSLTCPPPSEGIWKDFSAEIAEFTSV